MIRRIAAVVVVVGLLAVEIFAVAGSKPLPPIPFCRSGPVAACFSPDGKWILTADNLCEVALWRVDAKEAKPEWTVRATNRKDPLSDEDPYDMALAVGFSTDGKRVFCGWNAGVTEIDRQKGTVLRTTKLPNKVAHATCWAPPMMQFVPGADECVYYGENERLVRFNFTTNKSHEKFDLRLPQLGSLSVTLSPDRKRVLAYNGGSKYLSEWELETGELCRQWGAIENLFFEATYTGDGDRIWLHWDKWVILDRVSGKSLEVPKAFGNGKGNTVWFSPDGKHAIRLPDGSEATNKQAVEVLQAEDGKVLRSFPSREIFHIPAWKREGEWEANPGLTRFTPDGKTVLLLRRDPLHLKTDTHKKLTHMGLWDVATGKEIRIIREEK